MKQIIFILIFFISYFTNAQIKNIYDGIIDSVVIKTYSYYDKETSTINDTLETKSTTISLKKLKNKEIDALNKKMKSRKSYSKNRALLSHSDLEIIYYFNNKKVQNIIFSSITKNLTIYKLDKCVFQGQTTSYFEKEIGRILKCNR